MAIDFRFDQEVEDGGEWVINGHKWFTSGAYGADLLMRAHNENGSISEGVGGLPL